MESKGYCGVVVSWLTLLLPILSWLDWYAGRLLFIEETKRCPTYKPPFPLPRDTIIVYRRSCDTFPASPSYFLSIGQVSIDLNGQQGFRSYYFIWRDIRICYLVFLFSFPLSFFFSFKKQKSLIDLDVREQKYKRTTYAKYRIWKWNRDHGKRTLRMLGV